MAANFHWKCAVHGIFEGPKPGRCPQGCGAGMVEMVWLQMPGTVSAKTRTTDSTVKDAAKRFGLTDIQSRAGRPAVPETYRWNQPEIIGHSKPYSVPVDPKLPLAQQVAAQGGQADEFETLANMKKSKVVDFKYQVVADDPTPIKVS